MQLLYCSTVPLVEFASVSLLLKDEHMGEALVVASPVSTTPHAHDCLVELHEYLGAIRTDSQNNDIVLGQLSMDAVDKLKSIQVFRSTYCGLALYYLVIRDLATKVFSVLLGANTKFPADQVQGAVLCVGVSGLYSAHAGGLHGLTTRLVDTVQVMKQMEGDPEDCKLCYKALMTTLLLMEDEERRTNGMVDAEQVTLTLEADAGEEKQSRFKNKRNTGLRRGLSGGSDMKLTIESTSSADVARIMEKQSAVFSVAEKDCVLRKYKMTGQQRRAGLDLGGRTRRRKRVDEADLRDFDFQQKELKSTQSIDLALSSPPNTALQRPQKDTTAIRPPKSLPAPRGGTRRAMAAQGKLAKQRQAAFDAFSVQQENTSQFSPSFDTIAFPGFDDKSHTTTTTAPPSHDSIASWNSTNTRPRESANLFDPFDTASLATTNTILTRQPTVVEEETESGEELRAAPSDASIMTRSRIQVNIALNEDLTCAYRQSRIASCLIEGVVQVQIKSEDPIGTPFFLLLRDPSKHIKMIQENRRYAEDMTETLSDLNEEDNGVDYKFIVTVPRADNYFPVMRYKCNPELRPVPIRVQTRARIGDGFCRVALQISSNPANQDDLTDLTISMGTPPEVRGETLTTIPPGGVWNPEKRLVIWCVAELGDGEKFQLQAQFEIDNERMPADIEDAPKFPVLVRCQCMYAQLSDIELEVADIPDAAPAEVTMKLARRFRLSHRERA